MSIFLYPTLHSIRLSRKRTHKSQVRPSPSEYGTAVASMKTDAPAVRSLGTPPRIWKHPVAAQRRRCRNRSTPYKSNQRPILPCLWHTDSFYPISIPLSLCAYPQPHIRKVPIRRVSFPLSYHLPIVTLALQSSIYAKSTLSLVSIYAIDSFIRRQRELSQLKKAKLDAADE